MDKLTAQIFVEILNQEMQMPPNSVWIRDQNRLIPNDDGLYIVVGFINSPQVIGNVTSMVTETVDDVETQHQISEVQLLEIIQIDVLSRSNSALRRNWEVIAALQSFYSQQQQELHNFKIFRIPRNFLNTSAAEGGSTLNRYSLNIAAMVWYRKDTLLNSPLGDYYDDFETRADDKETIGTDTPLFEFENTPDSPPPP